MTVSHDFPLEKGIDSAGLDTLKLDKERMSPSSRLDVAKALEIIGSTFRVTVPEDVGLTKYFEILEVYPAMLLEVCVEDIIRTFKYPRLPLPYDFTIRLEPLYIEHRKWLIRTINAFIMLHKFKEQGAKLPENKYLVGYKDKK